VNLRHRVVAHADLGAEHILELDGTLTGIIDWSDAAITDPALDFARLYRDFGPGFLEDLLQVYGPLPGAMPRIEFFARCAALEDLAYGHATGRGEYVANAERSLDWLFPPRPLKRSARGAPECGRAGRSGTPAAWQGELEESGRLSASSVRCSSRRSPADSSPSGGRSGRPGRRSSSASASAVARPDREDSRPQRPPPAWRPLPFLDRIGASGR
jgi:hypothetical protein